jgi:hypothetical protein
MKAKSSPGPGLIVWKIRQRSIRRRCRVERQTKGEHTEDDAEEERVVAAIRS